MRPAFQFYPGDWQRDAALRSCSVGARGLWIEMICVMHQAEPYGCLLINGRPVDTPALARIVGATAKEVTTWLAELESAGVFTRVDGAITSRRMVRDERIRNARASGGKLGGNPALMDKGKVDRKVNLPANLVPTPSSSSSSSTSEDPPLTPAGGRRSGAISFVRFIEQCHAASEKPISGYEPAIRYANDAKLPMEFVNLCWAEFKRRHSPGGGSENKRQADWRRTFLNCLQGNWYRLWWAKAEGEYELTTSGLQAKSVHCVQEAA